MRHVDAMMFSRWTVASVLMVAPLVVGCGAKTGTEAPVASACARCSLQALGHGQDRDGEACGR